MRCLAGVLLVGSLAGQVRAEPIYTLRMASVVPEGSAWAREIHTLTRDIEQTTDGQVRLKWYLGGIAGDDVEAGQRIARNQLDGLGAGAWQCERWAPTVSVTRLPTLIRSRAEARYVATHLRAAFEDEFRRAGFAYLGTSPVGPSMIFLRDPVRTFAELRRVKLWALDNDATKVRVLTALGLSLVPMSFGQSRQAYDDKRVDGFLAPPTGALAFQWSSQARYLLELTTDHILGCMVIASRAFDRLPVAHQRAVRAAAAKFAVRLDEVGAQADERLIGGLFEHQGLKILRPDPALLADFEAATSAVLANLDEKVVPRALVKEVQEMLAAYRAEQAR